MKNLYFIYGKEKLSIDKRIKRILNEAKIDDFNINTYDMNTQSIESAISDCLTIPFMSTSKVVIIKNPGFLGKTKEDIDLSSLYSYIKQPMESTILIINACEIDIDDKKEIVKVLTKYCETISVKKPSEIEMYGWLKMQCNFVGIDIKEEAVRTFFNLIGINDLVRAKNEVEKLINYVGRGGVITSQIVNDVVMKDIESDTYKLVNMLMSNNKNHIISLFDELLKSGNDPVSIINRIFKSLKLNYLSLIMLNASKTQADLEKDLQISSKQAFYLVKNAKNFDLDKIKRIIVLLGDLDYKIKSGKIDPRIGLEYLLMA